MKIGRNEWFLGLFLVGVGLIVFSRFVPEGPAPRVEESGTEATAAELPGPLETQDPVREAARGEPEEAAPVREVSKAEPAPALVVRGLVIDPRGVPLEGVRVEALERPAARPGIAAAKMADFLLDLQEALRRKQGREELDMHRIMSKLALRHVASESKAGSGEPHTLSGPDGRFTLGPLPWERCWLWACKGALALDEPVEALGGSEALLVLVPAGAVAVSVLDETGAPVAQCPVHLVEAHGPQQMSFGPGSGASLVSSLVGRTGPEGRALFSHVPLPGPYLAVARPQAGATVAGRPVTLREGALEEITLRLQAPGSLLVRVSDERGEPLGGVQVSFQPLSLPPELLNHFAPPSVQTDGAGQARLTGLPPGEGQVHGLRLGREPGLATCTLQAGKLEEVDLVLPAGISLVGQVTGPEGAGLPDALVGLIFSPDSMGMDLSTLLDPVMLLDPASATRSDRSGAYLLGGLPDRTVTLIAWAPGYAPGKISKIRPRPGRTVNFRLQPAGGVAGTVLEPDGSPAARFTARLWQEVFMGMRRLVKSGEFRSDTGEFRLADLPQGEYTLRIEAPGHPPREVPGIGVEPAEFVTLADPVRLTAGATLTGEVRAPDGRAAAGVAVRLTVSPAPLLSLPGFSTPSPTVLTDPEGRFRFELLAKGSWSIEARAQGLGVARQESPIELEPGQTLEGIVLVLQRPAGIRGSVYGAQGDPDPHLRIMIQRTEPGLFRQIWTSTDDAGCFSVSDLEPGLWQVIAMGGDLFKNTAGMLFKTRQTGSMDLSELMKQPRMTSARLEPGEIAEVTLGLPGSGGGTLLGFVRQAGKALSGAMVTAIRSGEEGRNPHMAVSDGEGAFRLERLPAGRYRVSIVSSPGAGQHLVREALIEEGVETRIDVAFGGSVLIGRLVPQEPCGPLGNQLILFEGGEGAGGFALTDAEGKFRLEGVGAGTYRARTEAMPGAGAPRLAGFSEPVVLGADRAEAEILIPVRRPASLQGSIEGGPLENARVRVEVEGWPVPFRPQVKPDGSFVLHGLFPGRARVSASSGEREARLELLLVSGETHAIVLPLRKP